MINCRHLADKLCDEIQVMCDIKPSRLSKTESVSKKKVLPKRHQLFSNGQGGVPRKTSAFTSASVLPSTLAEATILKYKLAHA